MKAFVARVDDRLHAKLKQRADAEGRSINSVVVDALEAAVSGEDPRVQLRVKAKENIVVPPQPDRVPSWAELKKAARGAGSAVSEALAKERSQR